MTLIKSISGIRGTIGGIPGEGLTPIDIVRFTSAYATLLHERKLDLPSSSHADAKGKIVVGRDARTSGAMVDRLVCGTLMGMGFDVMNLGMAATPTVEIAVAMEKARGGIILTASHNPGQWNALKLLNEKGEFISADQGARILEIAGREDFSYAPVEAVGSEDQNPDYHEIHIRRILDLDLVDAEAIGKAGLKVVVDCVNSVGGKILPDLLKQLGIKEVIELYCEPNGVFPHNPEPLPEHLGALSDAVKKHDADLGFVVDPDVDRLAIVDEKGEMFGEEYTLVAVADYVLSKTPGNTVSNLSSTRALKDVTSRYGCNYTASAVGEVNVVEKMKSTGAVIGGEGNGGVIYPAMHYGRDALTGAALFLTHLAERNKTVSNLRESYPEYHISKNKISLDPGTDLEVIIEEVAEAYQSNDLNRIDGLKIEMPEGWVHLRKSNTEPIIRVYSEAGSMLEANALAEQVMSIARSKS